MRRFSSYGPINRNQHYHVPRVELIDKAYAGLVGENPNDGGHYITVWAPRQCGKTWVMQETMQKIKQSRQFEIGIFSMESLKKETNIEEIVSVFLQKMSDTFERKFPPLKKIREISSLFTNKYFKKPLILIIDEFDALEENVINDFASIFRDIFTGRTNERNKTAKEKTHLLHGLALIGVRSVLGIENVKGSPFNVQQSVQIPNFTFDETRDLFQMYEKESGQPVETNVIDAIFNEMRGQPGLTCWLGELLTDSYNHDKSKPITMQHFEEAYAAATHILPNNNILNIISKVKKSPYKEWILKLFKTRDKIRFNFDDQELNFLYMNGVIAEEKVGRTEYFVRFASPFVQKRVFNYFSNEWFNDMGQLVDPFENIGDIISDSGLDIRKLMDCYGRYLVKNKVWLFKDAPRRKDLRLYEAVYHFNLYMFIFRFLESRGGTVHPEFPTGNGKIDLVVRFKEKIYGLELKSFTQEADYPHAVRQAALYGKQLSLKQIALVFFVDTIPEAKRLALETDSNDPDTGVVVSSIFISTGS